MALSRSGSVSFRKNGSALSISVVSSRDGQHAGRCPVRRRCTGVINSCTSRQTVYAVRTGGVVKAHPKWQTRNQKTKQKGPEPCGVRASAEESLGGLRLCASSTRLHLILAIARPQIGLRVLHRIQGLLELLQCRQQAKAEAIMRSDAHEHVARCGASAVDADLCGFHDVCPVGVEWVWTVNSLYTIVNNFDRLFFKYRCGNALPPFHLQEPAWRLRPSRHIRTTTV